MEYVASGFPTIITAILWLFVWTGALWGVGRSIAGNFFSNGPLGIILSMTIGLFLLSLWVYLLGTFHLLTVAPALFFIGIGWFGFLWHRRQAYVHWQWLRDIAVAFSKVEIVLLLSVLTLSVLTLITALGPAIGNDALAYHLYFPKLYIEQHSLVIDSTHSRSAWPYMIEMLFTIGMLFQGVALAKAFTWLITCLLMVAVPSAVYHYFQNRQMAFVSFLLIASIPSYWQQTLYAYVDVSMALFAFMAFLALWEWKRSGYGRRETIISAMLLSALLSIKFYAITWLVLFVGLFVIVELVVSPHKVRFLKSVGGIALLVVILVSPWYLRSWIHYGNPVFPFLHTLFGGNGFTFSIDPQISKTFINFLWFPWHVVMESDKYGAVPSGVLSLALLPLVILGSYKDKLMKYILITAFVSSAIWFFTAVLMRLAFPIFPFLVILLSAGVVRFFEHRKSLVVKLIGMSLLFLFFAQLAWSAYYPLRTIKGALGIKSAELFLSEHERGFSFLKRSASFLDGESVLLSMGAARLFYSPAKSILYSHAMFDVLTRDGGSFESWLKKHHVTHILTKNMAKNVKHPLEFVRNDKKDGLRSNQFTPIISDTVYIEGIHTYGLWRVNL